ncbi:MAG: hypothetical protein M0P47_11815 [Bacteroidales bacterium]|nr:hypothetical protein [Bacteroidales bacterium]
MKTNVLYFWQIRKLFTISQLKLASFWLPISISLVMCSLFFILDHCFLHFPNFYHESVYPIITLLTFFTALMLGFYNRINEWKNSLEKRLTIIYIYYYESIQDVEINASINPERLKDVEFIKKRHLKPKTPYCLMIFEEAALAHEGDIRAWGQSLGQQINCNHRLEFYPFYSLGENKEIVMVEDGKGDTHITRQYSFFMFLEKIPEVIHNNNCGLLITDNYDDTPVNVKKKFDIREFSYKHHKKYLLLKQFITKKLTYINNEF